MENEGLRMRGLGTIINVALVVVGGLGGVLFGKRLKASVRETLMTVTGVAVIMLGAGGTMEQMLTVEDGTLHVAGTMMMIVSLALGALVGELLNIEGLVNRFGEWIKEKSGSSGDDSFVNAFVTASCTICIGAMAVVGSIQDGISGDYTILLAKGVLDGIIICMMVASLGKGCIFSAIPVALCQGAITLAAVFIGGFMTQRALDNLSYVGSVMIFCVGLNLIRTRQIRVANLLPAIVVAVMWGFISG